MALARGPGPGADHRRDVLSLSEFQAVLATDVLGYSFRALQATCLGRTIAAGLSQSVFPAAGGVDEAPDQRHRPCHFHRHERSGLRPWRYRRRLEKPTGT